MPHAKHLSAPPMDELLALLAAASAPANAPRPAAQGAPPPRPARSLPDLAHATRAIAGWFHNALDASDDHPTPPASSTLDDIVRLYVELRTAWERRETRRLATWMSNRFAEGPIASPPRPPAEAPNEPPRRALLIDDSSDILVTVGAFLDAFGFDVTVASSGETALRILGETRMHLLVTDHAMPGMTGKDLVLEARQHDQALRAMIITGYPDLQELQHLPPGVTVLAKPFRRAELYTRLRLLFEGVPATHPGTPARDHELSTPPS